MVWLAPPSKRTTAAPQGQHRPQSNLKNWGRCQITSRLIQLSRYFDPEANLVLEERLLRRMDAFDRRQGEIERDTALCLETLAHFVFYWLTRTEPIPEGERDAAHALGQRRFDHFIQQVAKKLGNERGVAARLNGMPGQGADHVNPASD